MRLRAVRIRGKDGRLVEMLDIREPVGLEMEFDVLEPGHVVIPHFSVHDMDGVQLFSAVETAPEWKGRSRPVGRYATVAWIPGNYLADGTVIVGAAANTLNPSIMHFFSADAVAFGVVDSYDGDSARGDFPGDLHGVVRPLLNWTTRYSPSGSEPLDVETSFSGGH